MRECAANYLRHRETPGEIVAIPWTGDVTLQGYVEVIARPGHAQDVMRIFRASMTFFKHADRDPNAVLEFAPRTTDILISLALRGLAAVGERLSDIQDAFLNYLLLHNPDWIKDGMIHPFAQYLNSEQWSTPGFSKAGRTPGQRRPTL